MKAEHALIKVLAVVGSVALAGGYLFVRSGGTVLPGSKSGRVVPLQVEQEESVASEERTFLPSSKSGRIGFRSSEQKEAPATAPSTQKAG